MQTSADYADRVYFLPVTVEFVTQVTNDTLARDAFVATGTSICGERPFLPNEP